MLIFVCFFSFKFRVWDEVSEGSTLISDSTWIKTERMISSKLMKNADLHMVQLMSLPSTVSCFSKIQVGFTFLLPAHLSSPCGDAFPIEGVLVATYLLSVEALPHCRCGVANKIYMVWKRLLLIGWATVWRQQQGNNQASRYAGASLFDLVMRRWWKQRRVSEPGTALARGWTALCSIVWYDVFDCIVVV